jgi:hypothetical protein
MLKNYTVSVAAPTTPDVSLMEETQYRVYDSLIATGLCLCFLIGLPGNCLALCYFLQTKKRNLSTLLYIVASSIDIGSSIIHLPLTANLFKKRNPGLLGNKIFCSVWYFIFLLLQQISIFVVMLMSISRALVIVFPFYQVNKKSVLISIAVYTFYHSLWNILAIPMYGKHYYSYGFGYCDFYSETTIIDTLYMLNYSACTGIPPIIVFVALAFSILKLHRQKLACVSQRTNRRSALTIVYFSSIFLVCNILTFINNALYTPTQVISDKSYPGPIYESTFMFFYSWLLSEIFCTVLNASLNPIFYLWRMKRMRLWASGLIIRGNKDESKSTVIVNEYTSPQTETKL